MDGKKFKDTTQSRLIYFYKKNVILIDKTSSYGERLYVGWYSLGTYYDLHCWKEPGILEENLIRFVIHRWLFIFR